MRSIVQHPKIAGLRPVWADFAGYSFICDHPEAPSGRFDFAGDPETVAAFEALEASLSEFGTHRLMSEALLCALNPSSYHVTAADLINDVNVKKMKMGRLSIEAANNLAAAFKGDLGMPKVLTQVGMSHEPKPFNLRFRFAGFVPESSRALMVRLEPIDAAAEQELDRLKTWRHDVCGKVLSTLNLSQNELKPHLTLGYFANQKRAERAFETVQALEDFMTPALSTHIFTFEQISLYGFVSMEQFFRIKI